MSGAKQPAKAKINQPLEREIEDTCDHLLELDGWRIIKTDLRHLRGMGVQEKGMADRLYLRYPERRPIPGLYYSDGEIMWIEWKRIDSRGRPTKSSPHQVNWQLAERARGAFVAVAGVDFEASIEAFCLWYLQIGQARKRSIFESAYSRYARGRCRQ